MYIPGWMLSKTTFVDIWLFLEITGLWLHMYIGLC